MDTDTSQRQLQILSLGFYRTGSQSLKEALTILGYKDVFHTSNISERPLVSLDIWRALNAACDANISCLPTYNGQVYGRKEWDRLFGSCEALTDVTPFSESLLEAYPDAKVILVHREFKSWATSYLETLAGPSYTLAGQLSGNYMEGLMGLPISQTTWKFYMGLIGVSSMSNAMNRDIMKVAYERHYQKVRRLVPKERLLECNLGDGWEPICKFLNKPIPDEPFPRLNESKVFRTKHAILHTVAISVGIVKLLVPFLLYWGGFCLSSWLVRSEYLLTWTSDVLGPMPVLDGNVTPRLVGGILFLAGSWWALACPLY